MFESLIWAWRHSSFTSHVRRNASQIGCKCWNFVPTIIFNFPLRFIKNKSNNSNLIQIVVFIELLIKKSERTKKKKPWITKAAPLKRKDRGPCLHIILYFSCCNLIRWHMKWWEKILHKDLLNEQHLRRLQSLNCRHLFRVQLPPAMLELFWSYSVLSHHGTKDCRTPSSISLRCRF